MKRLLPILIVVIAAVLASCATAPKPPAASLIGYYTMTAGGFNEELDVVLRKDFTYTMEYQLISCTDLSTGFSEEEGLWEIADGLVLLKPKTQTEGFPSAVVFAPAAFRRLRPKVDEEGVYPVHPEFPDRYVLTKNIPPDPAFRRTK